MMEVNVRGIGLLVEIFKEVVTNPAWALGCLLFAGVILVVLAAVTRFILYALQIGEERDRYKANFVFWKTMFYAGILYLAYIFLFRTLFPPDITLLVRLIATLPSLPAV
ncbi:MAG: hypothetical protein ACFFBD_08875 [Candidatus Hodarchaeota archaeon]